MKIFKKLTKKSCYFLIKNVKKKKYQIIIIEILKLFKWISKFGKSFSK